MSKLVLDILGGALEEEGAGLEETARGIPSLYHGLSAVLEHVGADALVQNREAPTFAGNLESENQPLRIPVNRIADHEAGDSYHLIRWSLGQQFLHGQVMGSGAFDIGKDEPSQDDKYDGCAHEKLQPPTSDYTPCRELGNRA